MLEKSELFEMYLGKRRELVKFADIRLLDTSWPKYLSKKSPFEIENGYAQAIPILLEVYGRWDIEVDPYSSDGEVRNVVFHSYMAVLHDSAGITLLDCYDGYPVWKHAIENGWMGSAWEIWTIRFEGELPLIDKLQLALYTHWQRLKVLNKLLDEEDTNRCLLEVIKAFQFMIGAIQRGRCTRNDLGYVDNKNSLAFLTETDYSALGNSLARCGFEWDEEIIETLGGTAVALSRNEGFTRFLQEYKADIDQACRDFREGRRRPGMEMDGFDIEFLGLRSFYYAKWWYREPLAVQILLMFVGMKCAGKVGSVWIWGRRVWKPLFRQVRRTIRECAEQLRFACDSQNRNSSMYSLLVQLHCHEGEGDEERNEGLPMKRTLVYHIGVGIANTILDAIYPLYRDCDSGTELDESTFNMMHSSCLEHTRSTLSQDGFTHSRCMARTRELA